MRGGGNSKESDAELTGSISIRTSESRPVSGWARQRASRSSPLAGRGASFPAVRASPTCRGSWARGAADRGTHVPHGLESAHHLGSDNYLKPTRAVTARRSGSGRSGHAATTRARSGSVGSAGERASGPFRWSPGKPRADTNRRRTLPVDQTGYFELIRSPKQPRGNEHARKTVGPSVVPLAVACPRPNRSA